MRSIDDPADVAEAVRVLRGGGLLVYPTETVYGIGCALSAGEPGIEAVRQAKGSPRGRPFLVLAASAEAAFGLWEPVPARARELAAEHWPGPLTLIGPARSGMPPTLLGRRLGFDTLSVRVPGLPSLLALLDELGEPLLSTSANRAGGRPPRSFDELDPALPCDFALDGGRCPGGVPSTLLSLVDEPPVVLRGGAIPDPF